MERRGFLLGLGASLAAPAIVKAESLMKIATLRRIAAAPELALPFRGGFTAGELELISKAVYERYLSVNGLTPALWAKMAQLEC